MRIVSISSNGGSQENVLYSNYNRSTGKGDKTSFLRRYGNSHGDHHQHES